LLFSMQTNLTLVDETFIPFVHEVLGCRVSTSFDPFGEARPVSEAVWDRKINLLRRNGIRPYVVSLLYLGGGGRGKEIYGFFSRKGLSFRLNAVERVGVAAAGFSGLRHSNGEYAQALKDIFDTWFMGEDRIRVDPCAEILSSFIMGNSGLKCPFTSKCAFHFIGIEPSGQVLPCGAWTGMGKAAFSYGNALRRPLSEVLLSSSARAALQRRPVELPDRCGACRWLSLCNGGCQLEAYSYYNNTGRETSLCSDYQEIFEHIESRLQREKGNVGTWLAERLGRSRILAGPDAASGKE